MNIDFNVEAIDPVRILPGTSLDQCDLMSPYVWGNADVGFQMLLRVVPRAGARVRHTGAIHLAASSDGLSWTADPDPVIVPGPDALDVGGCEDPTLVVLDGRYIVYYTGVDASFSSGQMLYAEGPDLKHLTKQGIALASSKTEGNTKEATIERTADKRWRLFYEYARDDASLIGLALGDGVAGPWHEQPQPFAPRPDNWDNWHLSTGPLWTHDPDAPVMFYNGATRDARWRIGWVAFDRDCTSVVDRCIEPLITPPPALERVAADIAFAASVVDVAGSAHLYYSLADRTLERAIVRRTL